MAAKVETLRTSAGSTIVKERRVLARFGVIVQGWMRAGRLGETGTAEMRRYTGAR